MIRIIIGFTVLLIGLAMIVLPGPAIVIIPVGLTRLGTKFEWAKRLMKSFTDMGNSIRKKSHKSRND